MRGWFGPGDLAATSANAARAVTLFQDGFPALLRPIMKMLVPRIMAVQVRAQGTGRLPVEVLQSELDGHLANLVSLLGQGPFFFAAERPSMADLAIFGQLSFLRAKVVPETKAAVERVAALMDFYRHLDRLTA